MASGQANTEIGDDLCPTITRRSYKDPPIVVGRSDLWCMVDDNAKSAVDQDFCGTLKVGGGGYVHSIQKGSR